MMKEARLLEVDCAVFRARLPGRSFERVTLGESGAATWRCPAPSGDAVYLKTAPIAAELDLGGEAARLTWLGAHGVPVPSVRDAGRIGDLEFVITEEVAGLPASSPAWGVSLHRMLTVVGQSLAAQHAIPVAGCPFDQRIAGQIEAARRRTRAGLVREYEFDDVRGGTRATDVLDDLLAAAPIEDGVVLTHGDFCLPNVIIRADAAGTPRVAGFVDCGRAGIADRYQDIALAIRSIGYNCGDGAVRAFLEAYGLRDVDHAKVDFICLLDEFF